MKKTERTGSTLQIEYRLGILEALLLIFLHQSKEFNLVQEIKDFLSLGKA